MTTEFQNILSEIIKPKLLKIGFRKNGNTFRKVYSEFTIILDFWKSQWNTKDMTNFWFEIGVFNADFYNFMFDENIPKSIRSNHCSINLRSGSILNKGVPHYTYSLTPENINEVRKELEENFNEFVIPFLENITSLMDILEFKNKDANYCDKVNLLVGFQLAKTSQKEIAINLITDYLKPSTYPTSWTDRILKECERFNLELPENVGKTDD